MAPVLLRTRNRVELSTPAGPVVIADARGLAMLVRLAAAPGRSLPTNELLLTVWPHLTRQEGARALAAAATAAAAAVGGGIVAETGGRWTLDPAVECDLDQAGPSSAAKFAAGLDLPDTPEWTDWVDATRIELASRPAPAVRPRHRTRILALAVVALASVAGYLASRPRPVAGFHAGDRVMLADIDHAAADSALGRSLRMAAEVALRSSRRVELVSRRGGIESTPSPGQRGGPSVARAVEIANRDGVPWVIAIAIDSRGARQTASARLVQAATGDTAVSVTASATGPFAPVEAVGRALQALARRLGESSAVTRHEPTLAFATSADLEALRAYTDGSAAWSRGEYQLAGDYWHRAVALDTGFALAMGSLGSYYYYHHRRTEGERWYRDALSRAGRLTEWERFQLEERYAGWRGDRDSALALARGIVAAFPRAATYYDLGTALLRADRCEEALQALQRARDLDGRNPNVHLNIATCQGILGRFDEAREAYRAAEKLSPDALYRGNINLEYAATVLHAGRPAEAESALVRMSRRPGMSDQSLGFRGLGFLAHWRGEMGRARAAFQQAADLSRQQGATNSYLRNLALRAAAERAAGDQAAWRRTLRSIDSLAAEPGLAPGFLGLAIEPRAAAGDPEGIRRLAGEIRRRADPRNRDDSVLIHYVTGTLALENGDPRTALAAFEQAAGYRYRSSLGFRRALAQIGVGELDSARATLARVVEASPFGSEDQIIWVGALIEIGLVEERLGRPVDAIASYRRFLEQWTHADPGLPDVIMVRRRLDALLGRRVR